MSYLACGSIIDISYSGMSVSLIARNVLINGLMLAFAPIYYYLHGPMRAVKQLLVLNITTIEQASCHFRLHPGPELKYLVNLKLVQHFLCLLP